MKDRPTFTKYASFLCLLIFSVATFANGVEINAIENGVTITPSVSKANRTRTRLKKLEINLPPNYVTTTTRPASAIQWKRRKRHRGDMKSPDYGKPIHYMPRLSIGPFYQTDNSSFGLYDLFAPITVNSHMVVFADGRYIDHGNTWEYNTGAGLRSITGSGEYLWTVYGFYDNRRTRFNNHFGQVTIGGDLQTERWYFNTNGYIPVGSEQAFVPQFNTAYLCQGNTRICYARGVEKSMGGWDAEVGYSFWHGFRAYAGVYVFARQGVTTAVGPNLRLQYDIRRENDTRILHIFDKIALLANWRDDSLAGSVWWAGARFDISLGPRPHSVGLERKMTSFIRRDLNVEMSSDGTGAKADITEPVCR